MIHELRFFVDHRGAGANLLLREHLFRHGTLRLLGIHPLVDIVFQQVVHFKTQQAVNLIG